MCAAPTLKAQDQAAQGYMQSSTQVSSPRAIELKAFQRVTAMLSKAKASEADFSAKAEAIHMNTKLWLILAVDVASPQNALPDSLRAQLFNLAEFSRKHGMKVLSNQAEVEPLIEINTAVMRGLRGDTDVPANAMATLLTTEGAKAMQLGAGA